MTNNTEDRKKQLANVDTAMMWLGDAQAWMDMAERLEDRQSKQEQNTDPSQPSPAERSTCVYRVGV